MKTTNTATVTPKKAAAASSPSAAAGQTASGQPTVRFATQDDPSNNADPPTSKKATGTSASVLKKRTAKLGANIVELIESQKPDAIPTFISKLAMEMVAANAYVTDRADNAKQFDLSTAPTDEKKWLPSNIKKIKIGLKTSKLEDDDFYKQLDAECKDVVEKFKNDLNSIYYRLAAKEEKHAREQRLLTFTTHAFALFRVYTKYYAECANLGDLSRPLDTSAARFLSRFMKGYLQQNGFFGFAGYLEVTLDEALAALTAHVPGMADPDRPMTRPYSDRTTNGTETTTTAAPRRDGFGYTADEHTIYKKIKEEACKYFLQVTKEVQQKIDTLQNETISNAKLTAWIAVAATEDATAACSAALATIPTVTPTTMDALMETTATKVSTSVSEKVAKKETKALFKQLSKKLLGGKNMQGGGTAESSQPKKGNNTKPSGTNKKQSGKKRQREYDNNTTSKKATKPEAQQQNKKKSPKQRPKTGKSKTSGSNGKGRRAEQNNGGGNGSTKRRR
jgi:hypothetical protein